MNEEDQSKINGDRGVSECRQDTFFKDFEAFFACPFPFTMLQAGIMDFLKYVGSMTRGLIPCLSKDFIEKKMSSF